MSNSAYCYQANTGKQQMLMDLDLGVPHSPDCLYYSATCRGDNESLVNSRQQSTHNPQPHGKLHECHLILSYHFVCECENIAPGIRNTSLRIMWLLNEFLQREEAGNHPDEKAPRGWHHIQLYMSNYLTFYACHVPLSLTHSKNSRMGYPQKYTWWWCYLVD